MTESAAREFFAVVLGITAGVYLGFAALDGRPLILAVEVTGIFLFLTLALLGLRVSLFFLAGGFLLHSVWDALHHPQVFEIRMAEWYRLACIVYDGVLAATIFFRWRSSAGRARLPG